MQLLNNADHLSQTRQYTEGVKSTFEYDHTGMPVSQKVSVGKTTTLERNYNWASGSRLMEVLDKVSGRKTSFDYDVFGSLAGANYGDGTSELKNPDSTGCLYESTKRTDRIYDKGGKLLRDKKWFYHYDKEGNLLLKSTRPINIATVSLDEEEDLRHPLFRQIEQERLQEKHKNEPTISHYTPEKADLTEWQSEDWAYEWFANGMLAKVKTPGW